ncbi:MAG: PorV/PorQ family protein [Saprospiraceae bacterium]|nr:PorV/PorQ family protein [Saprospiraceae bacterium]
MNKLFYTFICLMAGTLLFAGNPDRQGEAGAYELLMNPWARSAGLHTMNTASISGVEALRLNPAGLVRINKTELVFGHTQYLKGTDITFNAFGLSQKVGKSSAFGVSIMAVNFGDILETTVDQPEGTGGTFTPSWFNIGLSYAHMFENKVTVGLTFRAVSESTSQVSAFGFAIDAGVQYVTGPQDNVKFGISLRNIGSPMTFEGQGLSESLTPPSSEGNVPGLAGYQLSYFTRSQDFELPSALNIGLSYDFLFGKNMRLTALGNFTSNSFSRDQIGGGLEFSLNDMFMLRGAYRYEVGANQGTVDDAPIYSGPSAGVTVQVPTKKGSENKVGIDYAYRLTKLFNGTHNISVRFNM